MPEPQIARTFMECRNQDIKNNKSKILSFDWVLDMKKWFEQWESEIYSSSQAML